jgi:hypothetical protein
LTFKISRDLKGIFDYLGIINTSPAAHTLDKWVNGLSIMQMLIAGYQISNVNTAHLQEDGAPDGSSVKNLFWWDIDDISKLLDGSIKTFFTSVEKAGKKANATACGVDHTLAKSLGLPKPAFKLFGLGANSGGSNPKSLFFDALVIVIRTQPDIYRPNSGILP